MFLNPRLSLCIPTFNRAEMLAVCLESALRQADAMPLGAVEVLVSDNGSTDGTRELLVDFQRRFPRLRCVRNETNLGFDANYIQCMREAKGEFVWVMGDDDAFLDGAVARLWQEFDAGADLCLCAALECDLTLKPLMVREWFKAKTPAKVWSLQSREDLIAYLGTLGLMAGAFAFISAAICRREAFLAQLPKLQAAIGHHYIHAYGMMGIAQAPTQLHWIPEPLFLNRLQNDRFAQEDPWGRMMHDLWNWARIAGIHFPSDPELRDAYLGVLRENHRLGLVSNLRMNSGMDPVRWQAAEKALLAVGYDPLLVAAVDLAYGYFTTHNTPPKCLDRDSLCLADLNLVARGARKVAVLLPVGLDAFLEATSLLEALLRLPSSPSIRVVCASGLERFLAGFDAQVVDWARLNANQPYQEEQVAELARFAPELVINLDSSRGVIGDLLVQGARPAAALGFQTKEKPAVPDHVWFFLDRCYTRLLPPLESGQGAPGLLAKALGLALGQERLFLGTASREDAKAIMGGGEPSRTLVLAGDLPEFLAEPFVPGRLQRLASQGWRVLGVGGRGSFGPLQQALEPLGDQGTNLGGGLSLDGIGALLAESAAYLGGSAAFQHLARAAGCPPLDEPEDSTD